jgi:hypothetical protein
MRISLACVVLGLLVPISAHADKVKRLSDADQRTADAALTKGRMLQGKKDWAGAIAQFNAALKLTPDDPITLGELGWTQYLAKDLIGAEASTRKSLAGTGQPSTRGATFYNLGLIEEAKHDQKAAIAAYSESLKVRPNGVVRRTLAKLDAAAAAAFDPFTPAAMQGPFKSPEAYCAAQAKTKYDQDCVCKPMDSSKAKRALAAPFVQVEAINNVCGASPDSAYSDTDYAIVVKTAAGWFGAAAGAASGGSHCSDTRALRDATAVSLASGTVLVVSWDDTGECEGNHGGSTWTQIDRQIIGGTTTLKSTPLTTTTHNELATDDPYGAHPHNRTVIDVALTLAWGKDGTLTLAGKTTGLDKDSASNLLGAHTISFQ